MEETSSLSNHLFAAGAAVAVAYSCFVTVKIVTVDDSAYAASATSTKCEDAAGWHRSRIVSPCTTFSTYPLRLRVERSQVDAVTHDCLSPSVQSCLVTALSEMKAVMLTTAHKIVFTMTDGRSVMNSHGHFLHARGTVDGHGGALMHGGNQ